MQLAARQRTRRPRTAQSPTPCSKQTAAAADRSTAPGINTEALELARKHTAAFAAPQDWRSAQVVGVTLLLWLGTLLVGSWWVKQDQFNSGWGLVWTALWVFARAGALVRTFVLMHDAIHYALFTKRWVNALTASLTGVMVGMDAWGK